jgi:predicted lipoprotein with Yx(FWY)xxD motif
VRRLFGLLALIGATIAILSVLSGMTGPARADTYTVGTHPLKIGTAMETAVLTNSDGLSLYYNSSDKGKKSTCTGSCAKIWPPLINDSPTLDPKVKGGKIGVVHNANGAQVTFNGHLLYTYSKDSGPGMATGYGKAGKWFVATPSLGAW